MCTGSPLSSPVHSLRVVLPGDGPESLHEWTIFLVVIFSWMNVASGLCGGVFVSAAFGVGEPWRGSSGL